MKKSNLNIFVVVNFYLILNRETYEMSQYKILREYWFKHVEEDNKKTCVLVNKDEANNVWKFNFLESQYITRKQICEHFRKEFNSDEVNY